MIWRAYPLHLHENPDLGLLPILGRSLHRFWRFSNTYGAYQATPLGQRRAFLDQRFNTSKSHHSSL
jgi:hypothetical protein